MNKSKNKIIGWQKELERLKDKICANQSSMKVMMLFVRELSTKSIENMVSSHYDNKTDAIVISIEPEFDIDYDGETKLFNEECKEFMSKFVNEVFSEDGLYIPQEEKAKFGLLVQHPEGREWFGKFIDTQRVNNKEVDEFTFYRLVQYFAVCLFECNISDDFGPATSIMNMCFTYHFTSISVKGRVGQASKQYVYEYLTDQPIWKSLRFWNAAFLVAIHADRTKRTGGMQGWNTWNNEQKQDFETGEENSTFAHLASFLYMMKSFGIGKEEREEFMDKMSTIGNLRPEQIAELEESGEIL